MKFSVNHTVNQDTKLPIEHVFDSFDLLKVGIYIPISFGDDESGLPKNATYTAEDLVHLNKDQLSQLIKQWESINITYILNNYVYVFYYRLYKWLHENYVSHSTNEPTLVAMSRDANKIFELWLNKVSQFIVIPPGRLREQLQLDTANIVAQIHNTEVLSTKVISLISVTKNNQLIGTWATEFMKELVKNREDWTFLFPSHPAIMLQEHVSKKTDSNNRF